MPVQNSNFNANRQLTIQSWLVDLVAKQLSLNPDEIQIAQPLTRYGLDSIDAVTMVSDLEDWLDLELPATLFWDSPTIEKAARYLEENFDIAAIVANWEKVSDR